MVTAENIIGRLDHNRIRIWLAPPCDDQRFTPATVTVERRFPASAPAGQHCAGVSYVNQNASGGSFLAILEGLITPIQGSELVVRVGVPPVPEVPGAESDLLAAVIRGIERVPPARRPAGDLELTRFVVHPVDLKYLRWEMATTWLLGLLGPGMAALLARNATSSELWAAFEDSIR